VISDSILLCICISMGRHIIPEVEKVNMAFTCTFARPVSTYKHFCPLGMPRLFQS
jgi:hypothetical protein